MICHKIRLSYYKLDSANSLVQEGPAGCGSGSANCLRNLHSGCANKCLDHWLCSKLLKLHICSTNSKQCWRLPGSMGSYWSFPSAIKIRIVFEIILVSFVLIPRAATLRPSNWNKVSLLNSCCAELRHLIIRKRPCMFYTGALWSRSGVSCSSLLIKEWVKNRATQKWFPLRRTLIDYGTND